MAKYLAAGECHVALIKGRIVGVFVLQATSNDTVELMNIAVDESFQRLGIGAGLITEAVAIS